jgi:hypothetical protein
MSKTVKFDEAAFRRGVNDALSLRPLRDAVRSAANSLGKGRGESPKSGKSSVVGRAASTKR